MLKKLTKNTIGEFTEIDFRNLQSLQKDYIFITGLIIKLALIFLITPLIHVNLFLPFIRHSIENSDLVNPWTSFIIDGGKQTSFPYGSMMLWIYLPLTNLGKILDTLFNSNYFIFIGFKITTLIFDYLLLILISLILRDYSKKFLLIVYWISPVVLFINYWHGQLDIIPVTFLLAGICFLRWNRPFLSSIFIVSAISAKFSMILALPFISVYLLRNRKLRKISFLYHILSSTLLVILCITYFSSEGLTQMVLMNSESNKIFATYLKYSEEINLYLLPFSYLVTIYLFWRLKRLTFDLFIISIGLGFFSILLFLSSSPGWYLWIIPFIVIYSSREKNKYQLFLIPFYVSYISYYFLYSDFNGIYFFNNYIDINSLNNNAIINSSKFKSIIFTFLQASSLSILVRMYMTGIMRNNYYKFSRNPLIIAINSKSDYCKLNVSNSLYDLIGADCLSSLDESSFFKWDSRHPMSKTKNIFDAGYTNLSKMSRAIHNLYDGKNITVKNYNRIEKLFEGYKKVKSKDYILLTGNNLLSTKSIQKKFSLTILFEIDKLIENHNFFKKINPSKYKNELIVNKDLGNIQTHVNYIDSKDYDISFKIEPVNKKVITYNKFPRTKVIARLLCDFPHEELSKYLIALCGINVNCVETNDLQYVNLELEGECSSEDISEVAIKLIPNLEDLITSKIYWRHNQLGLIQLIILIHLSEISHRGYI